MTVLESTARKVAFVTARQKADRPISLVIVADLLRAIDIAVICRDAIEAELVHRIEAGEPYFHDLRERWSAALRAAHMAIPRPPYGSSASSPDPGL